MASDQSQALELQTAKKKQNTRVILDSDFKLG
jgi:hypothetical protein